MVRHGSRLLSLLFVLSVRQLAVIDDSAEAEMWSAAQQHARRGKEGDKRTPLDAAAAAAEMLHLGNVLPCGCVLGFLAFLLVSFHCKPPEGCFLWISSLLLTISRAGFFGTTVA